jgi:GTP:adenosylcobinamide-phosphate guanylyltransferase
LEFVNELNYYLYDSDNNELIQNVNIKKDEKKYEMLKRKMEKDSKFKAQLQDLLIYSFLE